MSDQETFISHLIELRQRLVRAVGAVLVLFVILFIYPGSGYIYDLLAAPLMSALPEGAKMIATGVITPFMVPVKVTALAAVLIALPYVLYQAWAFVAPSATLSADVRLIAVRQVPLDAKLERRLEYLRDDPIEVPDVRAAAAERLTLEAMFQVSPG